MSADTWIVFGILGGTIALFLSDRLRLDLVALMALLALMLAGILGPAEALAGFSDDLVLIVAGLFVVGGGLFRTGVASWLGARLGRAAGAGEVRLLAVIMVVVALLSAVMSSTGTVAIFLPVTVALAQRAGVSPSRLLIPLAFSSLLGGMLTLIGTPPNIVVARELAERGEETFGFFSFTPIGLCVLVVGVGFMLTLGRKLLPDRPSPLVGQGDGVSLEELARAYGLSDRLVLLEVDEGSRLDHASLAEADVRGRFGVTVLDVVEPHGPLPLVGDEEEEVDPARELEGGYRLVVLGAVEAVDRMCGELGLRRVHGVEQVSLPRSSALAEVQLTPRSRLLGRTLRGSRFRQQYDLTVLSLQRLGKPFAGRLGQVRLRFGDTLLVQGSADEIEALRGEARDFVVVADARGSGEGRGLSRNGWLAAGIMVGMLVLMTTGVVPTVVAVLLAAVAMVLTRCLSMEGVYRSMSWESVVLIAAMLPMATALEKTGGMGLVVDGLTGSLGQLGPLAVMAGLFVLTSLFSQFISNTATTVLVAPIAYEAAQSMHVSPHTFLITVAIAASTAFATPIATPVNTLVMSPGGYRFTDYTKVGLGLQAVVLVATLALAGVFFPLTG